MFYTLTWVWPTWVYVFVKTRLNVYLISVNFTVYNHTSIKRKKENK